MDLDEMKSIWANYDRKLDESIRLNRELLHATRINGVRPSLQRLLVGMVMEAVLQATVIGLIGAFVYSNWDHAQFALPGVALDLLAIAVLIAVSRHIAVACRIRYDAPIGTVQRQLEALRKQRIQYTQWTLLLAPLAWVPLLIVCVKGLWGADAYQLFGGAWLIANLACGVAAIPVGVFIAKRFHERLSGWPAGRRLVRDIAGYNLAAAAEFLATIAVFESEE